MSKVVASRDTRLDSGGTRKQRISSFFQGSSGKEIRRLYRLKPENPRIGLDRKSGQAFLDHEVFTKSHRLNFHPGKNSRPAYSKPVNQKTRPFELQLARAL